MHVRTNQSLVRSEYTMAFNDVNSLLNIWLKYGVNRCTVNKILYIVMDVLRTCIKSTDQQETGILKESLCRKAYVR